MLRRPGLSVAVVALFALGQTAALAAATLDKQTVPANTEVQVILDAPLDELPASNDKVTLDVPDGFAVLSCDHIDGFTCSTVKADRPRRTVVTWQRSDTAPPPSLLTDHFPFRMRTSATPGKYTFAVSQTYSNGDRVASAPVLQVTAPTTSTTAARSTPTTRTTVHLVGAPKSAPRRVESAVPVTEPAWFADNSGESADPHMAIHESGAHEAKRSFGMMIVGAVAALAAGGVFWFRRRVAPNT